MKRESYHEIYNIMAILFGKQRMMEMKLKKMDQTEDVQKLLIDLEKINEKLLAVQKILQDERKQENY